MTTLFGLIALILVGMMYLFVSIGGILWPGGPQLEDDAARNLSFALILVALLLCGVVFGGLGDVFTSLASQIEATRGIEVSANALALTATSMSPSERATIARATAYAESTQVTSTETPDAVATSNASVAQTASAEATPGSRQMTETAEAQTPSATFTQEASPTPSISPSPTPTPVITALPLDPSVLIDTVLRIVIERANQAEIDALLNDDESLLEPWWAEQSHERVLQNVRNVSQRFVDVTNVTWEPVGDGIQLLSSTQITATYTTHEIWTFVGTINRQCPDGSLAQQRYVESYPFERYTLELRDSIIRVIRWDIGPATIEEVSPPICP